MALHYSIPNGGYRATVAMYGVGDLVNFNVPGYGLVKGRFSDNERTGIRDGLLAIGNTVDVVVIDGEVISAETISD